MPLTENQLSAEKLIFSENAIQVLLHLLDDAIELAKSEGNSGIHYLTLDKTI